MTAAPSAPDIAAYDELTGLPNRRMLVRELSRELDAVAPGHLVGLAVVDIDQFQPLRKELGHRASDEVLTVLAKRLDGLAGFELVARIDRDRFGLINRPRFAASMSAVAERLGQVMTKPIATMAGTVRSSLSVGTAVGSVATDARAILASAIDDLHAN